MTDREEQIVAELGHTLDGLAVSTIAVQKRKLGLESPLGHDDLTRLVDSIEEACTHLAGTTVAKQVGERLRRIVDGEQ